MWKRLKKNGKRRDFDIIGGIGRSNVVVDSHKFDTDCYGDQRTTVRITLIPAMMTLRAVRTRINASH